MGQFVEKYNARVEHVNSLLCVGLDPKAKSLPNQFINSSNPLYEFNLWIIRHTHEYVSAYKPNIAFYEASGVHGLQQLKDTVDYLHKTHPDIPIICDAKRGDISSTNDGYVEEIFDWMGFDAVTINPYLGFTALQPFLERSDKGCIVLCKTSNPGAGEFQDLLMKGKPLWQVIAERVRDKWNELNNCLLVVGATYPEEMAIVRELVGDMTLLVPGIGAQGGDIEKTIQAGLNSTKKGMIINSARSIIFASNPAEAAKTLRDEINKYRSVNNIT